MNPAIVKYIEDAGLQLSKDDQSYPSTSEEGGVDGISEVIFKTDLHTCTIVVNVKDQYYAVSLNKTKRYSHFLHRKYIKEDADLLSIFDIITDVAAGKEPKEDYNELIH